MEYTSLLSAWLWSGWAGTTGGQIGAALVAFAAVLFFLTLSAMRFVQSWQLNGYRFKRYFAWLRDTRGKYLLRLLLVTLLGVITLLAANALFYKLIGVWATALGLAFLALYNGVFVYTSLKRETKTPLKLTPRILRLFAVYGVLLAAASLVCSTFLFRLGPDIATGLLFAFLPVLSPALLLAAQLLLAPFEALNAKRYLRKACKKLARLTGVKVIGITGSFAKTTVKNMLYDMLSQKYKVVKTPESYNTPLGVSRTILTELTEETEYFLCEMGARQRGDIAELCRLAPPQVAVLTGIAPQHLEYFGSLDAIKDTKYELIEALPPQGFAVFGPTAAELYGRAECDKTLVGTDLAVEDLTCGKSGTTFTLRQGGAYAKVKTRLLGSGNAEDAAIAAAVCVKLGFTPEEAAEAAARIRPVPHRLELTEAENGIAIVDDSYNSNPVSAKVAVDTVAGFPGRKVVVTPGFVELGDAKDAAHEALGAQLAEAFDTVILVGQVQTAKIREALERAGFDGEKLVTVSTRAESQEALARMLQPGDTVLFLNDLPDNYTESV